MADHTLLQRFHVHDNVWKFRHPCRFAPNRFELSGSRQISSPTAGGLARKPASPSNWRFPSDCNYFLANSSSIFLASGSSLLMRKLRICPAEDASGLAAMGEAPLFHLACNMELSEPRSAAFAAGAFSSFEGASSTMRQVANTPSPSSTRATPPFTCCTRPVTLSPSLCSAIYSSRLEGTICLMLRRTLRLAPSTSSTWAFTLWPTLSTSCG